ncbi:MAG: hypothetical protein U0931_15540 [Vulcanimicrobiota bacterium]
MSLVETVLALFLLTVGMLLLVQIFLFGLRYTRRAEKRALAATIAQKHLSQLRVWARQGHNFGSWTAPQVGQQPDSEFPGYQVKVTIAPHAIYSPATALEQVRSLTPRKMSNSAVLASVTAWEAGSPDQKAELWSLIGEPEKAFASDALVIQATQTAFSHGAQADFSVKALDSTGVEYPDVFFQWYVQPKGGNGTVVSQSRDGKTARFQHAVFPDLAAAPIFIDGKVDLVARAIIRGKEVESSLELTLTP